MSTDANFGHVKMVFGIVKDVANDPTQTGQARVSWLLGGAQDQINTEDLPWSKCMHPAHNTNYKQLGGPHTGLTVNSHVVGLSVGGDFQDVMIIGSVGAMGNSVLDDPNPTPNSDIPQGAKQQTVGNFEQPNYGDVSINSTADTSNPQPRGESVVIYAQNQGGNDETAQYASLEDSIGYMSTIA